MALSCIVFEILNVVSGMSLKSGLGVIQGRLLEHVLVPISLPL